ncbi:MAG: hypothetical protein ACOY0T_28420 [Myxococcota bacterium]
MTDNPDNKKPRVAPSTTKSYNLDGTTAEFDPGAFQVHAISPELRRKMLVGKLPERDPKFYQDTLPPNVELTTEASPQREESPGVTHEVAEPGAFEAVAVVPKSPSELPTVPGVRRARVRAVGIHKRRLVVAGCIALGVIAVSAVIVVLGGRRAPIKPMLSAAQPVRMKDTEQRDHSLPTSAPLAPSAHADAPTVRVPSAPAPASERHVVAAPVPVAKRIQAPVQHAGVQATAPEPRSVPSVLPAVTPSAPPAQVSPSPTSIFDTPLKPLTGRTAE